MWKIDAAYVLTINKSVAEGFSQEILKNPHDKIMRYERVPSQFTFATILLHHGSRSRAEAIGLSTIYD